MKTLLCGLILQSSFILCVFGSWIAWERTTNQTCLSTCKRTVTLTRRCVGSKKQCPGSNNRITQESCTGDLCVTVDGGWSDWVPYSVSSCTSSCMQMVWTFRICNNPPPSPHGMNCLGTLVNIYQHPCTGYGCFEGRKIEKLNITAVDGHWSDWKRIKHVECSEKCNRVVSFKRTCTNPSRLGRGRACSGASETSDIEECTGDSCSRERERGHWSSWSISYIQSNYSCLSVCRREVDYMRRCLNGEVCDGPSMYTALARCSGGHCRRVHGQWSVWNRHSVSPCQRDCIRFVTLTRYCKRKNNAWIMLECSGTSQVVITESCKGGSCIQFNPAKALAKELSDLSSDNYLILAGTSVGILMVLLIVVSIGFYRWWKRNKTITGHVRLCET